MGSIKKYVIIANATPINPSEINTVRHPNIGPKYAAISIAKPTPRGMPR